ncbi:MAG: response regulator [Polyangiaceae bacterium]
MLKVLVVDDQASVRTALELLFDVHDIPVLLASTPEEALALIAHEEVGLVIQDMNYRRDTTSGEEGVDLMRRIRKLDPDLPIVLMTAYTSLEMAVRLVKEGANDYLAKPWDDDKLVTVAKISCACERCSRRTYASLGKGSARDVRSASDTTSVASFTKAFRCTRSSRLP